MGKRGHRGYIGEMLDRLGYRYDTPSWQEAMDKPRDPERVYYPYCRSPECAYPDARILKPSMLGKFPQRRCDGCGGSIAWEQKIAARDERRLLIARCDHEFLPVTRDGVTRSECINCQVEEYNWERGWRHW